MSVTESFLTKLSKTIAKECPRPENVLLVLPSRRAAIFLKSALAAAYNKTILAPQFYTFDDLVAELTSFSTEDRFSLFLKLHQCYQELLQEEGEEGENLESFLNWAPTLISDFNDIDRYGINGPDLFSSINEVRALETWNINGEPLTQTQEEYIALWKRIGKLYHRFKADLVEQETGYAGLAYRIASENIDLEDDKLDYDHIYFAGFNALSNTEETIVKKLVQRKKASIYFDADDFYLNNEMHEAGTFIREYIKNWSFTKVNWIEKHFEQPKEVNIRSCPSSYAQAIVCADILANVSPDKALKTAIVLNREDLLLPVLYNLPENISALNITMGYPVGSSPIASFINAIIAMWQSPDDRKKNAFYYRTLMDVLNHSFFCHLHQNTAQIELLKEAIIHKNYVYVSQKHILKYLLGETDLSFFFEVAAQNVGHCNQKLLKVLEILRKNLTNHNQEITSSSEVERSLLIEQVYHYTLVFNRIAQLIEEFDSLKDCSLRLFRKLIQQLINKEKIPFVGEPLKGVQLMGLLETRALDFDHVILLNVNEGVLPAGKKTNSLLPYDIKRTFGLPNYQEQDAIFAHHFYRLLQRSKKIDLIYQNSSDDFGAGAEPSRFIEQMRHEFPPMGIQLNEVPYEPKVEIKVSEKAVFKNEKVIQKIKDHLTNGLSPSAINKFLSCPLDYYYRYVLGLGEQNELEEDIQSSTFGTCIHNTIEKLHEQHLGKVLDAPIFKAFENSYEKILKQEFLEFLNANDLVRGKNLLTFEAAKRYLFEFLEFQRNLSEKNQIIHWATEKIISAPLAIELNDNVQVIKLKGTVDSIVSVGGTRYLLDYKSGKVEANDLKLKSNKLEIESIAKKQKALQLLSYAFQYYVSHPDAEEITPCIYSFRNKQAGFIPLLLDQKRVSKSEVLSLYPELLQTILSSLLNTNDNFMHDPESKYCQYCL